MSEIQLGCVPDFSGRDIIAPPFEHLKVHSVIDNGFELVGQGVLPVEDQELNIIHNELCDSFLQLFWIVVVEFQVKESDVGISPNHKAPFGQPLLNEPPFVRYQDLDVGLSHRLLDYLQ